MDNQDLIMNFPITVYGNLEKYNETLSRGRCRIFYKGRNRNGTYITDEFAQKLLSSIPYTPVKGIYDAEEDEDFTDHGEERTEGRIYGIVPENPNLAWEKHLDEDGVEREYACVDVLYFTALYPEAKQIPDKGQSMELYKNSIKGEWKIVDGARVYVFTEGCFLGLQVLGDKVEPCFEGASFYTLYDTVKNLMFQLEEYQKTCQNHKPGGSTMPNITFKISDGQKYELLWALLNPNYNEEGGWTLDYNICEVYETYAIARNYAEGIYERVYYTKNDETDSVEITGKERCYMVDVTEVEKRALDALQALNGGNFELVDERFATIEALTNKKVELENENSNFSTKVSELEEQISTLSTERDEAQTAYSNLNANFEELQKNYSELNENCNKITVERDALIAYRKTVEDEAKKAIITSYSEHLSSEIVDKYLNNLDAYSMEDLDMRLTYEVKLSNPNLFSRKVEEVPAYIPKDNNPVSSLSDILSRYEK